MSFSKRLLKEKEENNTPGDLYYAQPLATSLYRWHFTLRGAPDTPFEHGLFHGYVELPDNYPLGPPDFYFLNENGRFEPGKKICLNITSFHSEQWTPAWSIGTMLQAIVAFFPESEGGVGAVNETPQRRKQISENSRLFICPQCGPMASLEARIWPCKS